jgi:uncharacterized protein YbjT (DUF2867 family)
MSVSTITFDFYDQSTWAAALDGQKFVFLVRPPAIADVEKTLNPFIDLAKETGVEHITFLSVAGGDKNQFVPHRKVENHIASLNDRYTIICDRANIW